MTELVKKAPKSKKIEIFSQAFRESRKIITL